MHDLSDARGGEYMYKETVMSLGDSILISLMGLLTVFAALIFLALAVTLVSKVLNTVIKEKESTPKTESVSVPAVSNDEPDTETYAAIIAAIAEEMKVSPDQFQIISIQEI